MEFELIPFPANHSPAVNIRGEINRTNDRLSIHYHLYGNLENIAIPAQSTSPGRKHELWKATCFEFFLAIKGEPGYWEFNLSPSGDWNVYRMDAYRRAGFREEAGISQLPFELKKESEKCLLRVSVDLASIIPPGRELEIAVTSVIQTKDGTETYWALAHPAAQPDFHLRESFILPLATQMHPSEGFDSAG